MPLVLPRLYVILDAALADAPVDELAENLFAAGVRLFQYRDKRASWGELLRNARTLAEQLVSRGATFMVNDRPDAAFLAGASGVHIGQDDVSAEDARAVVGPSKLVGVSTHNRAQFEAALKTSADYLAVGPIFATGSKENPDPVVGTALLKELRRLTERPIVAIGGITLDRATEVMEAGADAVAVISGILRAADPAMRAREFLEALEAPRSSAAT